jgi:hypothetical protein
LEWWLKLTPDIQDLVGPPGVYGVPVGYLQFGYPTENLYGKGTDILPVLPQSADYKWHGDIKVNHPKKSSEFVLAGD